MTFFIQYHLDWGHEQQPVLKVYPQMCHIYKIFKYWRKVCVMKSLFHKQYAI